MKLVTKEVYTQFVQDLNDVHGLEVDGTVEAVVQTINDDGVVRAQIVYFEGDGEPQYMIDKRVAWGAALRAARAQVEERGAVVDALFPAPKGVLIDG